MKPPFPCFISFLYVVSTTWDIALLRKLAKVDHFCWGWRQFCLPFSCSLLNSTISLYSHERDAFHLVMTSSFTLGIMSEDYTQRQLAINYAVFAFALSTTVARLYTRGCLMRQLGLEDAFITFAIVAEIGLLILYRQVIIELTRIMAIVQGDSNSTSAMSPHASRLAFVLKIAYFNSLLYPIAFR